MKVKIVEHSGEEHITEVEKFDAQALYEQIKAAQNHDTPDYVVVIGDVIIDGRSIKAVVPVRE
ncbi:hypothetical protein H839_15898 [Parageobacillus genomosp. 1]|uniref:Uncharacterized protein n=1 Tax=Parageobacillus genomosp. 1 TaxID=1295642 RepID=A0ABC9VA91_9BACL|nr:hypothetical protein [Parageobacillus genomosp. 1]EZP74998.1 hypothetical protein H839_15898 [Parageobacillus genomosp. 1]